MCYICEKVQEKTILWKAGNKVEYGFLVVKGAFKFIQCKEAEHGTFEKGAFLGEVSSMLNNEPLTTTVKAVSDGLIYVVKKDDLLAFLEKNPGLLVLFQEVKFFE